MVSLVTCVYLYILAIACRKCMNSYLEIISYYYVIYVSGMNKKNKCQVNREKEKCLDYSHHKLFRRIEAASRILAQELA